MYSKLILQLLQSQKQIIVSESYNSYVGFGLCDFYKLSVKINLLST